MTRCPTSETFVSLTMTSNPLFTDSISSIRLRRRRWSRLWLHTTIYLLSAELCFSDISRALFTNLAGISHHNDPRIRVHSCIFSQSLFFSGTRFFPSLSPVALRYVSSSDLQGVEHHFRSFSFNQIILYHPTLRLVVSYIGYCISTPIRISNLNDLNKSLGPALRCTWMMAANRCTSTSTTTQLSMENSLTEFFAYPFDTDEAYQVSTILKLEYQEYIVHIQ